MPKITLLFLPRAVIITSSAGISLSINQQRHGLQKLSRSTEQGVAILRQTADYFGQSRLWVDAQKFNVVPKFFPK